MFFTAESPPYGEVYGDFESAVYLQADLEKPAD